MAEKLTPKVDVEALRVLGTRREFGGLETFPSHSLPGNLTVTLCCTEFTCRCPVTGQPDWADIIITYTANRKIVESKSVKLYMEQFREKGIFHEHLAKLICDDFQKILDPLKISVSVEFNIRGGISITATESCGVEYDDSIIGCG